MSRNTMILIVVCVIFSGASSALASPTYAIINLGCGNYVYDVNANGQAVGSLWIAEASAFYAFIYSNGTITDLNTLLAPGSDSTLTGAEAINDSGWIVGNQNEPVQYPGPGYLYNNGAVTTLDFDPHGINNLGQVVGAGTFNDAMHACLWSGGSLQDLGVLSGYMGSTAYSINDSGQVVGYCEIPGDAYAHAFLYENGSMTDLGDFGFPCSVAYSINANGQVVGGAVNGDYQWHAFLYQDGVKTDLGSLGGDYCVAFDINSSGQIVGESTLSDNGSLVAFIYSDGEMTDLNTLIDPMSGWSLSEARAINDSGWIVGRGYSNMTGTSDFLLIPIPEPCGHVLLGMGILGIIAYAWRRRK